MKARTTTTSNKITPREAVFLHEQAVVERLIEATAQVLYERFKRARDYQAAEKVYDTYKALESVEQTFRAIVNEGRIDGTKQ